MNNKQLLFVFLGFFTYNNVSLTANKMDKQEALYFLPQQLVVSCDNRFTDECSFIAQHIKAASQLREQKTHTEFPNRDERYWLTLSKEEKKAIGAAAITTILDSPGHTNHSVALQEVFEALQ